jgi:hypothetical protein
LRPLRAARRCGLAAAEGCPPHFEPGRRRKSGPSRLALAIRRSQLVDATLIPHWGGVSYVQEDPAVERV